MAKEKFDRTKTEKFDISKIGVHEGRKIPTPIITNGAISVDVNENAVYSYGIDVISLVISMYGKNSEIYKTMSTGENISGLIEKSIQEQMADIENKKRLLEMCKEREKLVEESQNQTL